MGHEVHVSCVLHGASSHVDSGLASQSLPTARGPTSFRAQASRGLDLLTNSQGSSTGLAWP